MNFTGRLAVMIVSAWFGELALAGGEGCLMLDGAAIERSTGIEFVTEPAEKYKSNPVMSPEYPWEGKCAYLHGTVLHDPLSGLYRMWYQIANWGEPEVTDQTMFAYAESSDGIGWERPTLGITDWKGSKENNIVFRGNRLWRVIQPNVAVRRDGWRMEYLMLYFDRCLPSDGGSKNAGLCAAVSEDGLRWRAYGGNPVWSTWLDRTPEGNDDVLNILYDPELGKYVVFRRVIDRGEYDAGRPRRIIARAESADFFNWTGGEVVLRPDEGDPPDTQFYQLSATIVGGLYVGFLAVYHASEGTIDIQLAWSHDGREWRRSPDRRPFIGLGPEGSFDSGMILTAREPVEVDGDLRVYYGGFDSGHNSDPSGWNASVGLAIVKKDRFVAACAGEEPGDMVTRTLRVTSKKLWLNYKTEPGGWIRVGLSKPDGGIVPGFTGENAEPLSGDHTERIANWGGRTDVPVVGGGELRLHFIMKKARLYAFGFKD